MNVISKNNYLKLFEEKKKSFSGAFKKDFSIEYYPSPFRAYRHRAEFSLINKKDDLSFAMTVNGRKEKINSFPIASQKIQDLMEPLRKSIQDDAVIKEKLFQVEFQSSRSEEVMVSLIYHKNLDVDWQEKAREISNKLKISIIGRSKNQKIIIGNNFVTETYNCLNKDFSMRLYEQCFSQTNPFVCDDMLTWVATNISRNSKDILELHCGLGTFTIPLSHLYRKVLATENSRPSIQALNDNIFLNNRKNIYSGRLSGKETLEALQRKRNFRRLQDIDLDEFEIKTIFLDPPREGLDVFTIQNLINVENIIYISCGFESFKRDLKILQKTHRILDLALFDQFPYTDHIESGAILKRIAPI